jgi:DNA polymerase-3 subunit delta'
MAWQQVRGHEAIVAAYGRAVRRGRLAHAYLFTGPKGVGKHRFALELAKALLCENRPADELLAACDRCASCLLVDAETHPDLYQARRPADAHEFPIGLMRELCQAFSLRTARGRGKVVVIDDADDLNDESANCFLKTLEEPPPGSVLILIGSSPDRQLPTVVSRCQVVRFAPLAPEVVEDLLREQGIGEPAARHRLALLSDGSPGRARELADPALWSFRNRLVSELSRPAADTLALTSDWMKLVADAGKDSSIQRGRARLVIGLLTDFFTDLLKVRQGGAPKFVEDDDQSALTALAKRADTERVLSILERCLEADAQVERRVQLVLVVEGLVDALGQQLAA